MRLSAPRTLIRVLGAVVALALELIASSAFAQTNPSSNGSQTSSGIGQSVRNDRSRPLRDVSTTMLSVPQAQTPEVVIPEFVSGNVPARLSLSAASTDTVVQTAGGRDAMPSLLVSFEGLSSDDNAQTVGIRPIPPDTVGDVGPNHYVQTVNVIFAVYDKSGYRLLGPLPNSAMWAGFGGPCETTNAGDAIVLYDHLADRWLFSQFTPPTPPFHQCVAVSATGDPTGEWYRYDFVLPTPRFNDYPKFGVWPDGYYMSASSRGIPGPQMDVLAFERTQMLAGQPARAVAFVTHPSLGYTGALPVDLDGPAPSPGTPNYFVGIKQSEPQQLLLFQFHVDWDNLAGSTFGLGGLPNSAVPIEPFALVCPSTLTRSCVPQPGTSVGLDALSGRYVMFRAQYRNFGTHESIVFTHTVDAGDGRAAIRWYETRDPGGSPVVHQQGTYAPQDGLHRWMGSAAADRGGNLAIGYSIGGTTMYPSIAYAGRLATDPLGELSQAELIMQLGTGAQLSPSNRWGDYSMMAVDPTDDCTFWYTAEYIATTGTTTWQTRIGSFRFPGCSSSGGTAASAEFLKVDETTQGSWQGRYGAQGAAVIGDAANYPSYAQVTASGVATWTWESDTTDVRALERITGPGRLAATWYGSTMSIDVDLTDGQSHQVALYAMDWDHGARVQRVDVRDAVTGALLDSRTQSAFDGGHYLVWRLKGHVVIQVVQLVGVNAVVSGVFFDAFVPTPGGGSAQFVKLDTMTQGTWRGTYGADGLEVIGDAAGYPSYAQVTTSGVAMWTWEADTGDVRAPERISSAGRIAATWYGSTFTIDVNETDGQPHQVALYSVDWDHLERVQRVDVRDVASGVLLDRRTLSSFDGGQYLVWRVTGHVVIEVVNLNGPNAVVSAVFFDPVAAPPAGASAQFVKMDATTQGTWHGTYGADGAAIVGDEQTSPPYALLTFEDVSAWTWEANTTDVRALERTSEPGRLAATFYGDAPGIHVVMRDGQAHHVALYMVDYDSGARVQQVEVRDANTGGLLDSRTVSDFTGGQYLVWRVTGHVVIRITRINGVNAVVSGFFFDPVGAGGAAPSSGAP